MINADFECPYCGAPNSVEFDHEFGSETVVQDCQNCCNPIVIERIQHTQLDVEIMIRRENE